MKENSHSQESDYIDYLIVCQSQIKLYLIELRCLFYHPFTNLVFVIFLLLLLLQSATNSQTNSILTFRLGSLLSNETIFTFLRAPKAEMWLLPKHSSSNHMRSVESASDCL